MREDIESIKQSWYQTLDLKGLSDKINRPITMSIIPEIDKNSHHARIFSHYKLIEKEIIVVAIRAQSNI